MSSAFRGGRDRGDPGPSGWQRTVPYQLHTGDMRSVIMATSPSSSSSRRPTRSARRRFSPSIPRDASRHAVKTQDENRTPLKPPRGSAVYPTDHGPKQLLPQRSTPTRNARGPRRKLSRASRRRSIRTRSRRGRTKRAPNGRTGGRYRQDDSLGGSEDKLFARLDDVRFHPAAETELLQGRAWYEESIPLSARVRGGDRQGDTADRRGASQVPRSADGTSLLLKWFPFSVFYRLTKKDVEIIAVAHTNGARLSVRSITSFVAGSAARRFHRQGTRPRSTAVARAALAKIGLACPAPSTCLGHCNALAIGFGPTERASDAVSSIRSLSRWVNLFFLSGAVSTIAQKLLQGSGSASGASASTRPRFWMNHPCGR